MVVESTTGEVMSPKSRPATCRSPLPTRRAFHSFADPSALSLRLKTHFLGMIRALSTVPSGMNSKA
jgi:hypothetical protein